MPYNITVLYENTPDAKFDLDYYLKNHMPMVQEKFGPHGMKGWEVQQFEDTPDGKKPYSIQARLFFDSAEQFQKALAAEAGPVMGDIPNFSNKNPTLMPGKVVGSS